MASLIFNWKLVEADKHSLIIIIIIVIIIIIILLLLLFLMKYECQINRQGGVIKRFRLTKQ